jgi:glycosyltransferase involved in cell wall biosynthesis
MKITQLMLAKGFGGAERYFVDLSSILAEHGHEVQVVCHRDFQEMDRLTGIPGTTVESFTVAGWWDLFALKKMRKAIERFEPDIVHAHLARGAYMAGKICQKNEIPLVVKTHNYVDLKYYKNVDIFITTTRDQQKYLVRQGVSPEKTKVIPNFSRLPAVETVSRHVNDPLVIASCGRMVEKKGFHILLKALDKVIESGARVSLRLGGDGEEKPSLLDLSETLGLNNQVEFCGWIDSISDFLEEADIFVLPSLDEPFGIVVLEAMARGTPLISTRTQGPSEILDEETSYLVETGSVDALAKALSIAISDKEGRLKKAEKALCVFNNAYSEKVVVPKIVQLYEGLTA